MGVPENLALVDMDGTICNYVGEMLKCLEKLRAPHEEFVDPFSLVGDSPNHQYLWDRMNLIKSEKTWWTNLPRFKLGFDVLDMAKELGYECEILTQAPKENPAALAGKLEWLMKHPETKDLNFHMTRNKSRFYGRVLVDDYPGYIIPWLEHRPRGLVIMPTNNYNKDFTNSQVVRYDGSNAEEVRNRMLSVKVQT